ncbi:MAG: hypothetical protein WC645_08660, partial [Candidatus Margulisiibacteriota bacterium]
PMEQPKIVAAGGSGIKGALIIDNFSDPVKPREWWYFDGIKTKKVENKTGDSALGKYYLNVSGKAKNWYVGGMGTYLGEDAGKYTNFSMYIEGHGEGSGIVKVELFEDDNGNTEVEQDKSFNPLYDDRWAYEIKVDWDGWQRVSVPFSDFTDINPKAGDNVWNPNKRKGSGGLLHVQIVYVGGSVDGAVDFNVANIGLTKE